MSSAGDIDGHDLSSRDKALDNKQCNNGDIFELEKDNLNCTTEIPDRIPESVEDIIYTGSTDGGNSGVHVMPKDLATESDSSDPSEPHHNVILETADQTADRVSIKTEVTAVGAVSTDSSGINNDQQSLDGIGSVVDLIESSTSSSGDEDDDKEYDNCDKDELPASSDQSDVVVLVENDTPTANQRPAVSHEISTLGDCTNNDDVNVEIPTAEILSGDSPICINDRIHETAQPDSDFVDEASKKDIEITDNLSLIVPCAKMIVGDGHGVGQLKPPRVQGSSAKTAPRTRAAIISASTPLAGRAAISGFNDWLLPEQSVSASSAADARKPMSAKKLIHEPKVDLLRHEKTSAGAKRVNSIRKSFIRYVITIV